MSELTTEEIINIHREAAKDPDNFPMNAYCEIVKRCQETCPECIKSIEKQVQTLELEKQQKQMCVNDLKRQLKQRCTECVESIEKHLDIEGEDKLKDWRKQ